jgi:4-cresol dehydrogenase (hydroxylating)
MDRIHSLMCDHTIPSQTNVSSPVMNGSADPELVRLRTSGGASDADWERYAQSTGRPFWSTGFVLFGASRVIDAQWEHIRDRMADIAGVQFAETASWRFPLSDEEVEAVPDKARLGIPSLNLFGSRNAPGQPPSEGHLDFSPMIRPRAEELIDLYELTGRIYGEHGMNPTAVVGMMYHPRSMICFHAVPTYRNATDNQRSRALFEQLVTECGEHGWNIYRTHAHFQTLGMSIYDFNDHALLRLHETLKDAIDPRGVISPGRYDIWPRHLRGGRA